MTTIEKTYNKENLFKPEWAREFKHYNQMDKPTFYLAEFIWEHQRILKKFLPRCISIKSLGSSYYSDRAYVLDKKTRNPAKFIYTLPSVKTNVICGILEWEGPVYCFIDEVSGDGLALISDWIIEVNEGEHIIKIKLEFNLEASKG